jgi:hypothetical protein
MIGSQKNRDPERTLGRCEAWSGRATLAILVGIVLEILVILSLTPHSPEWDKWFNIAGNGLIGIGLVTEYICIRKTIVASAVLKQQSDAKLSEALDRATNAELELIKFRRPRRDLMTSEAKAKLSDKLKPFARTPFDVGFSGGDGEQADFVWDIEEVLAAAGWSQLPWGVHAVGIMTIFRNLRPLAGSVGAQNVEIQMEPTWRQSRLSAVEALIAGLNAIGIETRETGYNSASTNVEAIHILIGPKR